MRNKRLSFIGARSTGFGLALIVGALGLVSGAAAQDGVDRVKVFTTTTGASLELPAISSLDCDQSSQVLDRIDASGYRVGAPDRVHPADRPLMDYENEVSKFHYRACQTRPHSFPKGIPFLGSN